jgi:hypothetical protein
MAIPPVDLAGAALGATQAAPDGAGFENALQNAAGGLLGGGGEGQIVDAMVQGGVQIMGGMMMRLAGEVLNEAMSDDEG